MPPEPFNPLQKIEEHPWWLQRAMRVWSVYGVLLMTGDMIVCSKVIALRKIGVTIWVDIAWHAPEKETADIDRMQLPTTYTWQGRPAKGKPGVDRDWIHKFNLVRPPSCVTHASLRLDHIVMIMELVDAAQN